MCHIHRNGWCNTQGVQPERRVLPLESRSYNKSNPSPKAYCFSEIDDRKPFLVVRILAWLFSIVLAYRSFPPKCTPWFISTLSHIIVVLQMLSYNYSTRIVLLYWPSLSSTLLVVDSLQALSFWSHVTSCNHPVQSIQENIIFHRADDRFSLEVLTPMESVSLSRGTWDSFSPPRVPGEVVRPRGSSDECNMTEICNVLCDPCLEGKATRVNVKIPFSTIRYPLISTTNASFIIFLCSPSFRKSQGKIYVKGAGLWHPMFQKP
jgi:hypothetical protein